MKTALILAALYGTLVSGNLVRAPYAVKDGEWTKVTASLPEADANRLGYKLVEDFAPATDSNHYAVAVGWAETNRIYRVYEVKENPPPPPRRFYKYDLSAACLEADFLDQFMAFINSDAKIKWFWDAAEICVESDPYFIAATNAVVQSGVITDAKVKQILDRAYELGQSTEVSK